MSRYQNAGQVLVMFVLFLLVLVGISALAIDYASWLLTDRALQNYSDHAALAGASSFDDRTSQGSCAGGVGAAQCVNARAQAWTSINNDLGLGLTSTIVNCLAVTDSPSVGESSSARANSGACTSQAAVPFGGHTIWVSTPPPNAARYTNYGGRYAVNFGVVWVRIDRSVRSILGGALGIQPKPRTGWATAGSLPTDFALQVFCRDKIAPESGGCKNDALSLDGAGTGAGGIWLVRGDIASNESLKLTAQGNAGVVVQAGNMFLVNGRCASSSWNCPASPATGGGIADANPLPNGNTANMKNAFYMPPQPVTRFASPVTSNTVSQFNCNGADTTHLCIPYKDQTSSSPTSPGSWTCVTSGNGTRCGTPTVNAIAGTVSCAGVNGGSPQLHYYVSGISSGNNNITTDAGHSQTNANRYYNITPLDNPSTVVDKFESSGGDTLPTPVSPSDDWVYVPNMSLSGNGTVTKTSAFTATVEAAGNRVSGISTVRYTAYKTLNGVANDAPGSFPVTLQVRLLNGAGTAIAVDPQLRTLTGAPVRYEFTVGAGVVADYNSLQLEFTFTETGVKNQSANERGGAVAWADIQHPDPQPATPPMIPPGYYKSIVIPSGGCAVLDPTAEYSSLKGFQMPGIYRFGGTGNGRQLKLNTGAWLIGDGVTLVFDSDWPDSGTSRGLDIAANGGLLLNTMRVPGAPPCTPTETEASGVNSSAPLLGLPYSAVCAAWGIDNTVQVGERPGLNAWHYCNPSSPDSGSHCVVRSSYAPSSTYRGVTFYFTPDPGWSTPHSGINIRNRFEMQGGVGNLAFHGVLYAPYDDVAIQGQSGFNTVGQVLAWTAKFHGGGAFIYLDYPYQFTPAAPYLLEPTINH